MWRGYIAVMALNLKPFQNSFRCNVQKFVPVANHHTIRGKRKTQRLQPRLNGGLLPPQSLHNESLTPLNLRLQTYVYMFMRIRIKKFLNLTKKWIYETAESLQTMLYHITHY